MNMVMFWAAAAVIFLVIEAISAGITSIWFALGALCALVAAVLAPQLIWLQAVWFAAISVLTLLLTRPLVRKYINSRTQATNADRVIGMRGMVREDIDNLTGLGAVYVDGKVWTARSAGGETISAGLPVLVRRIEGVKLIVEPDRETAAVSREVASGKRVV